MFSPHERPETRSPKLGRLVRVFLGLGVIS
jgi:hypothetical protein